VRAGLTAVVLAAFCAAAVACGGSGKASTQLLSTGGFKDKLMSAIITRSDLDAEAGYGPKVNVSSKTSLNTLSVRFGKEYAEYKANPGRLGAILRGLVERAKKRMEAGNRAESFPSARRMILPLLKPAGAFRHLDQEPAATRFPGDLYVAYGVQRQDSFMLVTRADVARWAVSLGELHRLALANLVRETNREQRLKCEEKLCGWASGDGFDAARMLPAELRAQIVRKIGPAVYAVPRESVFVALPIKLAGRIREKVTRDFVTAPNPVSPDLFVERDGELVVLAK
jgi:uncharacterized protein YtpQ (UPF0354 family)